MKKFIYMMLLSAVSSVAFAADVSWVLPTVNIDGTPLTDLAGVRVCYEEIGNVLSLSQCQTSSSPTDTSMQIDIDPTKVYYFVAQAVDTAGNYSPFSNVAIFPQAFNPNPEAPAIDTIN